MRRPSPSISLTIKLTIFIFVIMTISTASVGFIGILLYHNNIVSASYMTPFYILLPSLIISPIMGTILSMVLSRHSVKKLGNLTKGLSEIGQGNFTVRLTPTHKDRHDIVADNFNKMAQELSSIELMRDSFVTNFSHEFKTPIVSIQGFAKLLKDTSLTQAMRDEYLDIIIDESARLSQLANNTLLLSKLESQDIVSDKVKFSLDEQIRQSLLLLESAWQSKNITLQIDLPPITMVSNVNLVEQLWINLLSNAIKFSNIGGSIAISATTVLSNAVVAISDNGIGMSEETAAHVFDKYFQGDASHSTHGNGLGLSIAQRIVGLCGGTIRVKSQLGGGSTFIISLPL